MSAVDTSHSYTAPGLLWSIPGRRHRLPRHILSPHARVVGAQDLRYLLDAHRLADHMSLYFITTLLTQKFELLERFYAFRDHPHPQTVTHRYDGRCNRLVVRVAGDVSNKHLCDLQRID